jgi:hypothetical protein
MLMRHEILTRLDFPGAGLTVVRRLIVRAFDCLLTASLAGPQRGAVVPKRPRDAGAFVT